MFLVHPWKQPPMFLSYQLKWIYIYIKINPEWIYSDKSVSIFIYFLSIQRIEYVIFYPLGKMRGGGKIDKATSLWTRHRERSNLCDIAAMTLGPRSSSSYYFVYKTKYIWLHIQNMFVLLNKSSIRGVKIENIKYFNPLCAI